MLNKFLLIAGLIASTHWVDASKTSFYEDERPKVDSVGGRPTQEIISEEILEGMVLSLAQLAEAYPGDSIYWFLARDAEYLYDMAITLYADEPELLERCRLVNISTQLASDPIVDEYLGQFIEGGLPHFARYHHVWVETGFMGSVPDALMRKLKQVPRNQFDLFMLESRSDHYIGIKAFTDRADAADMENLPHYTGHGQEFKKSKTGVIKSVVEAKKKETRQTSQTIMRQVRHFARSKKGQELFYYARSVWAELHQSSSSSHLNQLRNEDSELFKIIEKDRSRRLTQCRFCIGNEPSPAISNSNNTRSAMDRLNRALKQSSIKKSHFRPIIEQLLVSGQGRAIQRSWSKIKEKRLQSTAIEVFAKMMHAEDFEPNEDYWNLFNQVITEKFSGDDMMAQFEDFASASLFLLARFPQQESARLLIKKAIELESEEFLERLLPVIAGFNFSIQQQLESELIEVALWLPDADSATHLVKIFTLNFFGHSGLNRFRNLAAHLLWTISTLDEDKIRFDWWSRFKRASGFSKILDTKIKQLWSGHFNDQSQWVREFTQLLRIRKGSKGGGKCSDSFR